MLLCGLAYGWSMCMCVFVCKWETERVEGGVVLLRVSSLPRNNDCLLFAIKNGVYLTNPCVCTYKVHKIYSFVYYSYS